jgi:site-specific recombinase XerD
LSEPRVTAFPVPIDRVRSQVPAAPNSELFRLLVDSVRDYAIFVLDPDGHVLTWNCELASQARVARGEAPIANSVRHVHCLKHSRGTSLAERGVNPYRIKLILGHKSMSSTERYLHGSQKQACAEAQRSSMEVF